MLLKRAYPEGAVSVPEGGSTRDDVAPGAGVPVVRRGAEFGSADALKTTWGPTSTSMEVRFCYLLHDIPANTAVCGRTGAGRFNMVIRTDGEVYVGVGGDQLRAANAFLADGVPHHLRVVVEPGGATVWRDGEELTPSQSNADGSSLATGALDFGIGGYSGATAPFPGVLWDFHLIDPASEANTAHFPLDTLDASGNYPNTHPGSTVGDATVTGTVLQPTVATTTPGSGVPTAAGPVVCMYALTSPLTIGTGVTGMALALTDANIDPYGWRSGSLIAPTLAGVYLLQATGRIRATVLGAASEPVVRIDDSFIGTIARQNLTLDTLNEWVPFSITVAVSFGAGADLRLWVAEMDTTNAIEIDDTYLTLTLYPELG